MHQWRPRTHRQVQAKARRAACRSAEEIIPRNCDIPSLVNTTDRDRLMPAFVIIYENLYFPQMLGSAATKAA